MGKTYRHWMEMRQRWFVWAWCHGVRGGRRYSELAARLTASPAYRRLRMP